MNGSRQSELQEEAQTVIAMQEACAAITFREYLRRLLSGPFLPQGRRMPDIKGRLTGATG
jgi:hypothetical protein